MLMLQRIVAGLQPVLCSLGRIFSSAKLSAPLQGWLHCLQCTGRLRAQCCSCTLPWAWAPWLVQSFVAPGQVKRYNGRSAEAHRCQDGCIASSAPVRRMHSTVLALGHRCGNPGRCMCRLGRYWRRGTAQLEAAAAVVQAVDAPHCRVCCCICLHSSRQCLALSACGPACSLGSSSSSSGCQCYRLQGLVLHTPAHCPSWHSVLPSICLHIPSIFHQQQQQQQQQDHTTGVSCEEFHSRNAHDSMLSAQGTPT